MRLVKYKYWTCVVSLRKYSNGRIAIILNDAENGEAVAVASVNLVQELMTEDQVALDEPNVPNITEALIEAGIVTKPVRYASSGFNIDQYPIVQIFDQHLKQLK